MSNSKFKDEKWIFSILNKQHFMVKMLNFSVAKYITRDSFDKNKKKNKRYHAWAVLLMSCATAMFAADIGTCWKRTWSMVSKSPRQNHKEAEVESFHSSKNWSPARLILLTPECWKPWLNISYFLNCTNMQNPFFVVRTIY